MNKYVHGYSPDESNRLHDQADSLDDLLHHDSIWDKNSLILEAGCGIGAQTKIIAPKNLSSKFISIDISLKSLDQAKAIANTNKINNVEFQQADIFELPFQDEYFDHQRNGLTYDLSGRVVNVYDNPTSVYISNRKKIIVNE